MIEYNKSIRVTIQIPNFTRVIQIASKTFN